MKLIMIIMIHHQQQRQQQQSKQHPTNYSNKISINKSTTNEIHKYPISRSQVPPNPSTSPATQPLQRSIATDARNRVRTKHKVRETCHDNSTATDLET